MLRKKKISKFTPFDRVLDGLEQEELIEEDDKVKIIKVYNRKKNARMFLLEKIITNEKEHLKYIEEIHKFENIQYDGLLCIDKWTYDMVIDQRLNKLYKFILVFDTYNQNLYQYIENIQVFIQIQINKTKKIQLLKEDIVVFFKVLILSLHYMQQQSIQCFNPVSMTCILICSDTSIKYNCIPLLLTPKSLEKSKKESILFSAPEIYKEQKTIPQLYQQLVYSFGLIFIQLFLLRNIPHLKRENEIHQCLKEIELKYGENYKGYLEMMVEQDQNKRIKLQELCQTLSVSQPQKLIQTIKVLHSETFEYYYKQYSIQTTNESRLIAWSIPWSRQILQSNLFNMKNYFLELLDLSQAWQISEQTATIIYQQFKMLLIGGINNHKVFELNEEIPAFKEITLIPQSNSNRWGFAYVIQNNQFLYICTGYCDQILVTYTHQYNIQTKIWNKLSDCLKPGVGCTLVCYNNVIIKYGGQNQQNKSLNIVEIYQNNQWKQINFKQPIFSLPTFSFAQQINPSQIIIVGGTIQESKQNTKVIIMNIDLDAQMLDSKNDCIFVEFLMQDQMDYQRFGPVEAMQISNNQLYLLQKKNEKQHYLTLLEQQGFVELRKIHM